MEKTKDLAQNTVIITIGKVCTQFLNFFLLPLYTALLTQEEYGIADLYLNYVNLLVPVITLQMDMGLFRFMVNARKDDKQLQTTMTTGFICIVAQSVIAIALYLIISTFVSSVDFIYLLLNVISASCVAMTQQAARGIGDNISYAVSGLISAAVQIGMNLLLICVFGWRTEALYLSFLCGNTVCALFLFLRKRMYRYIRFAEASWKHFKELLAFSFPLMPNAICWWGVNAADRTIVSITLGSAANGLLAISHKFAALYTTGISIFTYPWTESAVLHYNEPDRDEFFFSVISTMFRLFLALCLGVIAGMPLIFNYVVNINFSDSYIQIPFFLVASLMNTIVGLYSVVFQAAMKTKYVAVTSIIAALTSVIVDIALIRFIGLYAPAVAALVAYSLFAVIRYRSAMRLVNAPLEGKVVASGAAVLALILAAYYSSSVILHAAAFILAVVYSVIINHKFLNTNIRVIRAKLKRKK